MLLSSISISIEHVSEHCGGRRRLLFHLAVEYRLVVKYVR